MTLYTIERVRTHKGAEKDEEAKLKGSEVYIEGATLGLPIVARFKDGRGTLITSPVGAYNDGYENSSILSVQTRNTTYLFRKVSE